MCLIGRRGVNLGRFEQQNVSVNPAMFTTSVRVDGAIKAYIWTGILGDDGPRTLNRQTGPQGRGVLIPVLPPVVEILPPVGLKPPRQIGSRPSALHRRTHEGSLAHYQNKSRTIVA